jgi:hypothetical protein
MDYYDFLSAILAKTTTAVTAISDPHTRRMCARWCMALIEEERLVKTYLTCSECDAIHLRPARLHALIAWATDAEEVLTTLTQTPCPPKCVG